MKKYLLLLLCLFIFGSIQAQTFSIETNGKTLNYNITSIDSENTVEVIFSPAAVGEISIPSTVVYGGITYSVTKIGNRAFVSRTTLTSIAIPNTVTVIENTAFSYCEDLTSVVIPSSVTSIGNYAFSYCTALTYIEIPNTITQIGTGVFNNCTNLVNITLPNTITTIPDYFFTSCRSLTSFVIPNSVTSIGKSAFKYCNSLNSIIFSNSLNSIGDEAFDGCLNLIAITLPNSLISIGISSFEGCRNVTSVIIPNSLTNIGSRAFYECSSLTTVSIPRSLISLGGNAFSNCFNLLTVNYNVPNLYITSGQSEVNSFFYNSPITTFNISNDVQLIPRSLCRGITTLISVSFPISVKEIEFEAFKNCSGLTTISIFNPEIIIGIEAFINCNSLLSVTFPDSVKRIGLRSFENCTSLTSIIFPNTDTIYFGTFIGCTNLSSIVIPNSVTNIEERAFYGCTSLSSIVIPNSIVNIGEEAFQGCTSLTSINIPRNVTLVEVNVFDNCSNLTTVNYNAINSYVPSGIFSNCPITSFIFGDEVQVIPSFLCEGLSEITTITIPSSVTSIGAKAFFECYKLNTVIYYAKNAINYGDLTFSGCSIISFTIGEGVQSIPDYLCYQLPGVTHVELPNSLKSIGQSAFSHTGLTNVIIPDSVTTIGYSAYSGCRSLYSFVISKSVLSIGEYAFSGCINLSVLTALASYPPSIRATTFVQIDTSINVIVPDSSLVLYKSAPYWRDFFNYIEASAFVYFGDTVSNAEVVIETMGAWTANTNVPWLVFSPASGMGNDTIVINALPNYTNIPRSGIITISSTADVLLKGETTKTITIIQAANAGTAIEEIQEINEQVRVVNGKLLIANPNNEKVIIYNMQGKVIYNTTNLPTGVYIVKIGGKCVKVLL